MKAVKKATRKAREEGLEEGLEKGRKETTYAIVRQMKSEGLPVATIAKITGLTEDEIIRL